MDWNEIREKARQNMKGYCRGCKRCDGVACAGEVPGMGGTGTGNSFIENIKALDRWKVKLKTLHDVLKPDISTSFLGYKVKMPIFAAPMTGLKGNAGGYLSERDYDTMAAEACKNVGTIFMSGDANDKDMYPAGIDAIKTTSVLGIPFSKPRTVDEIIEKARIAKEAGAIAFGVDVDGAGLIMMIRSGQFVGPKSRKEIEEIVKNIELPLILKGIMTPEEAEIAAESGAKAIVVSNHGGRVLDFTEGTADVLPDIAKAVGGKIEILVDGGVRTGIDVLKMLSLGAKAVLIGRPIMIAAHGGGREAIEFYFKKVSDELYQAMILTGCKDLKNVPEVYKAS
ncbi:alpha-hydroxy-acid oxidizing enzyme [Thermoanaerobacterium thermosaccharolyticum]|uniref:L-lactate oxidase n=2 Tax=Thermoanaerobacterium thermosaccharolyticum TaxID=1517 RepID=L0IJI4_THETR|nr:alpha-hydroxy-acid oxidizing protein [Thermoanaerobacterium thermosaccharolyticum]AGB19675.1 alpha-hydroxyacid dehydrogenase, FMN-dependent L-lactate dehydrogenase [Thermoanaerobacterium thermosaccharolyticum M0795]AST56689.1 Alpha-hydroxyacid dehydrogenase, FMN-dependent L-lactate dehydrogenase [Thermoanaerobacterium thermosaccharolyticum]PHO07368.1 alpha-hydroxy-acid oxidizing enzyme [Thermoanaerobacterium thermosaccharolyticum]